MEKTIYAVVVSRPGCLPEAEPHFILGEEGAVEALRGELKKTAEVMGIEDAPPAVDSIPAEGLAVEYGGYIHSAEPIGVSRPGKAVHLGGDNYAVGGHIVNVEYNRNNGGPIWRVRPILNGGAIDWDRCAEVHAQGAFSAAIIGAEKLFGE